MLVNAGQSESGKSTMLKNFQGNDTDANQLSSFFFNEGDPQA